MGQYDCCCGKITLHKTSSVWLTAQFGAHLFQYQLTMCDPVAYNA